jgi:hypothetical protein
MSPVGGTTARLAAFAAVLVAAFGSAWAVGAAVQPSAGSTGSSGSEPAVMDGHDDTGAGHDDAGAGHADAGASHADNAAADDDGLPGLARTVDGYSIEPVESTLTAGDGVPFAFRVTDPDGHAVTRYTEAHEKDLHLIVVRRDLSEFQHVHPVLSGGGTWRVDLDLPRGGSYRAYADVVPTDLGRNVVLGTDLDVAGDYTPVALPGAAASTTVDGYDVTLAGHPDPGVETRLTFTVSRGGRPVGDLQPYLGAYGHLVTIRDGDLAYLHTHPGEDARAGESGGPDIEFMTTFPSAGTYRVFLDFQVGGQVRTAKLTVEVGRH